MDQLILWAFIVLGIFCLSGLAYALRPTKVKIYTEESE